MMQCSALLLLTPLVLAGIAPKPPLRLTAARTFKIAAFSDLHYGENEDSFGIPQDINSTRLMNHVLDTEDPDFVVLNGDLITGENTFRQNSTKYVDRIVQPLVQRGYRWSSTYGNHDSKYNLTREGILMEEQKYPNSYTQHGPPGTDGVSNYMIPLLGPPPSTSPRAEPSRVELRDVSCNDTVYPELCATEKPLALLYFLDSRGGSQGDPTNNDNIPNWVSPATAAWFNETAVAARARWGVLPSLAFVHIPTQAFLDLQNAASANVSGEHFPGLNADIPLDQQGNGNVGGGIYVGQDVPLMQAMLDTEGLHSVYSGHDHGDSWCGTWQESTAPHAPSLNAGQNFAANGRPFLCFCKHSGFGGYGTWNRGVRQIHLTFDDVGGMRVDTWDRMQWGSNHPQVITNVTLNGTYGQDIYSTVDGGYHPYS